MADGEKDERENPGIVVIGIGNVHRGDDAAGILAARWAAELLSGEPDVRFLDRVRDSADLINAWEGMSAALLVDAAASGSPPGTVSRFVVDRGLLPEQGLRYSTHSLNVSDAIELSRTLGTLPPVVVVWAIEGADFEMGAGLTPEVEAGVERAASAIADEVRALRGDRPRAAHKRRE